MKKWIGYLLWLLAFTLPFQHSLLNADEEASNVVGLISFVVMLAFIFIGYALVDSAKPAEHGH